MKDQIRKKLKSQRANLSLELFNSLSSDIAKNIKETDEFKSAQRIGFYHSVRGEADPSSLKTLDKSFFLPVLSKNKDEGLVFIQLTDETQFENNKFNIPEPVFNEETIVSAQTLDLVLVPLLAFDKKGNRLGMGGGFYDRTFAFKKDKNIKPILLGYAYDFQEIDALEPESWDVGLDIIATESGIIKVLLKRHPPPFE